MVWLPFFLVFGHFCPPGSGYESRDTIESGSNPVPDPDPNTDFQNPHTVDGRLIILVPDVQREAPAGHT